MKPLLTGNIKWKNSKKKDIRYIQIAVSNSFYKEVKKEFIDQELTFQKVITDFLINWLKEQKIERD